MSLHNTYQMAGSIIIENKNIMKNWQTESSGENQKNVCWGKKNRDIRRSVKEIDAKVEGLADRGDGVVFRDRAEDTAKGGSSKTDAAKFETRVS